MVWLWGLGGFGLALWWGRGGTSWRRALLAGLFGAGMLLGPFAANELSEGPRSSLLLGMMGAFSLLANSTMFRGLIVVRRAGARPAGAQVAEEIEGFRHELGAPPLEGLVGPPVGRFLLAGAAGLARPFVVVTNGVVHCLQPEERRAVLGHEVGHHATGSLWWLAGMTALAAPIAVWLGPTDGPAGTFALAVLLHYLLLCAVSRPIEFRCDALGAQVTSREAMARALRSIVAFGPVDHSTRASRILHCFWTHPATERRLARLARPVRSDQLWRDCVGPAVVVTATLLTASWRLVNWVLVALLAMVVVGLLFRLAAKPDPWKALLDVPVPGRKLFLGWVACSLGSVVGLVVGAGVDSLAVVTISLAGMVLALVGLPWVATVRGRVARRRQRASVLVAESPGELLEMQVSQRSAFARDPILLHLVALAKFRLGDPGEAEADHLMLMERWPRFVLPRATLAEQLQWQDPRRALELLRLAPSEHPSLAAVRVACQLRLGHLAEAREALQPALAASPVDSAVLSSRASIALAEGQLEEAHRILEEAAELSTTRDARLLITAARVALAMGDPESAGQGLAQAESILDGDPLEAMVLQPALREVRAEIKAPGPSG